MFDLAWWVTALALFLGCAVQTALGFGMAVVAAPIIILFRPEWVPIIITVVALSLSIQNSWNQRSGIEWKFIRPAMIWRIPGTLIGAWVLTQLPTQTLQLAVAGMVFIAIFVTIFAKPFPATSRNLGLAGFLSGIAGTTTSIGGPPLALVMQHGDSHNTRANLSVFFVYSCTISLISYQSLGLLSLELWIASFSFIPFGLVGFYCGKYARGWVDTRYRPILLFICSFSAVVALIGAVT